jgi:hypothetical protein
MPERFKGNMPPQEHKDRETSPKWQLLFSEQQGGHFVNKWYPDELKKRPNPEDRLIDEGGWEEIGLYDSTDELDKAIAELQSRKEDK